MIKTIFFIKYSNKKAEAYLEIDMPFKLSVGDTVDVQSLIENLPSKGTEFGLSSEQVSGIINKKTLTVNKGGVLIGWNDDEIEQTVYLESELKLLFDIETDFDNTIVEGAKI